MIAEVGDDPVARRSTSRRSPPSTRTPRPAGPRRDPRRRADVRRAAPADGRRAGARLGPAPQGRSSSTRRSPPAPSASFARARSTGGLFALPRDARLRGRAPEELEPAALRRDREGRQGRRHRRRAAALQERAPRSASTPASRATPASARRWPSTSTAGTVEDFKDALAADPGRDARRRAAGGEAVPGEGQPQRAASRREREARPRGDAADGRPRPRRHEAEGPR